MYHLRCLYTALPVCCCPEGGTADSTSVAHGTVAANAASVAASPATAAAVSAAGFPEWVPGVARMGKSLALLWDPACVDAQSLHSKYVQASWQNRPWGRRPTGPTVDFLSVGREVLRQRRKFLRVLKRSAKQKEYCMFCDVNEVDPALSSFTACGKCRYTKHLCRAIQNQPPQEVAPLTPEEEEEDQQGQRQLQTQKRKLGVLLPGDSDASLAEAADHECSMGGKRAPTRSSALLTALLSACSPSVGGGTESVSPTAAYRDSKATAGLSSRTAGRPLQEKQRRLRPASSLSIPCLQNGGRGKEKQEDRRERATNERGSTSCCHSKRCKRKGDPAEMLTCCTCGITRHASCCDPPLMFEAVTRFPWQCPDCKLCVVCEYNVSEETMLICDSCDRAYHMECLNPPVLEIPEGKWFCTECWRFCGSCGKELSQDDTLEGTASRNREPMCLMCTKALQPPRSKLPSNGVLSSITSISRSSSVVPDSTTTTNSTCRSRIDGSQQRRHASCSSDHIRSSSFNSHTSTASGTEQRAHGPYPEQEEQQASLLQRVTEPQEPECPLFAHTWPHSSENSDQQQQTRVSPGSAVS